jgi:ribonuclease HII
VTKYIIGIDEAGRGPLAGPVSVGAVMVRRGGEKTFLRLMRDSKQLSEAAREELFSDLTSLRKQGVLNFSHSFSSASVIDRRGIVPAIRSALSRCLLKLEADPRECEVLLDGSLYAPDEFVAQKTIIRGDASEPIISAASIVAKVMRDRYMERVAVSYPSYGFEVHKGYGTAKHRAAIRCHGLSGLHRASFCKSLHPAGNTV